MSSSLWGRPSDQRKVIKLKKLSLRSHKSAESNTNISRERQSTNKHCLFSLYPWQALTATASKSYTEDCFKNKKNQEELVSIHGG